MPTGIMLENVIYNLGREYKFYTIILLGERRKEKTTIAIRKGNSTQKI